MKLERVRDNEGKFTNKKGESVYKSIRLPKTQIEGLKSLCNGDENLSEKVREAIAFYLKYSGNTHT